MTLRNPEFKINIWRSCVLPRWYVYQIYRRHTFELMAGGECRSYRSAKADAEARIRQLEMGVA